MTEDDIRNTSLIQFLKVTVAVGADAHHSLLPARVEEYNPERQVVRVQPMVGRIRKDSDGVEHDELYPPIPEVPVAWPGAGGARLTFPLAAGDFGTLLFSDRSLDEWKVNRGVQPVVPKDPRNHALQDAVFLPGLRPPSNAWKGARTDAVTLGYANEQGQGMQVHITPAGIALGEPTPAYAVALAEQVKTELEGLRSTLNGLVGLFNTHVHSGVTTGPGSSGPTTPSASAPAAIGDVGSATVKVKG